MPRSACRKLRKRCPSDASQDNLNSTLNATHNAGLQSDPVIHEPDSERSSGPKKRQQPPPLPSTSRYLPAVFGGSHWRAEQSFENIVVFGDSYSKLNGRKTWVDHLERRLRKQHCIVEMHSFAVPGATAEDDLSEQLSRFFTVFPKKSSSREAPTLDPDKTTFFIFLGINDCGRTDSDQLEPIIETILDAMHDLYVKSGARNFVLANVPPIDRSPQAVELRLSDKIEERVKTWNDLLRAQAMEFAVNTEEVSVLLFSPHQVLTEVLEDPSEFDFDECGPTTEGGGIWEDDLHLTTDMHDTLAERLLVSVFKYQ